MNKPEPITYAQEILINATLLTKNNSADLYEFVVDDELNITECVHVASLANGIVYPITDFHQKLSQMLFELNHVRVNPRMDNSNIIKIFTTALHDVGVKVKNQPQKNSVAICFKPLGEINEAVRFHCASGKIIFLSTARNLRLVS